VSESVEPKDRRAGWLNRAVGGIGATSFFSDLGHEITTSLLPSLFVAIGAPAAALGLIEGLADGASGLAKLAGGALADDPERRRTTAVGGYTATAVLSGAIGLATAAWQVGVLRVGAWIGRGIRGPSKNALLADAVPAGAYGRAYGFERAMDNTGAIGGPLVALLLLSLIGLRPAMLCAIVPGLLASVCIVYAIRHVPKQTERRREKLRLRVRPVLRGALGRLMLAVAAFELGNMAATLLILRANELLQPGRGETRAAQIAVLLYVAYNVAAAATSIPAGHLGDRRGMIPVFRLGAAAFLFAYGVFALTGASIALLAVGFLAAGVGIGFAETAETAAVARLAGSEIRGSAFGILAGIQSFGNFAASAVAGALWTWVSPEAAFVWAGAWMLVALIGLLVGVRGVHAAERGRQPSGP
jgi:MFS family permease